eukprot:UN10845
MDIMYVVYMWLVSFFGVKEEEKGELKVFVLFFFQKKKRELNFWEVEKRLSDEGEGGDKKKESGFSCCFLFLYFFCYDFFFLCNDV